MAFEDLKERFSSELKDQWGQFQESDLYIKLNEKYENLTPPKQKLTLVGLALLVVYLIFSYPLGSYMESSNMVTQFEDTRSLIRDLLKASREAQESPDIAIPPPVDQLKSQIDGQLQAAHLLPEQIVANEITQDKPSLIPTNLSQGVVKVTLQKLNLRQVSDLGYQLQAISPSVKMVDFLMEANAQDPRYFNVVYRLAILAVPSQVDGGTAGGLPDEPAPPKGRSTNPKKRGG